MILIELKRITVFKLSLGPAFFLPAPPVLCATVAGLDRAIYGMPAVLQKGKRLVFGAWHPTTIHTGGVLLPGFFRNLLGRGSSRISNTLKACTTLQLLREIFMGKKSSLLMYTIERTMNLLLFT